MSAKPETFLVGLAHDDVVQMWDDIKPLYERALVKTGAINDFLPEDILEAIEARDMQGWIVHDRHQIICAVATQILVYPRRKVFGIVLVGAEPGTISSWLQHFDILKDFALAHGCSAIRGWGRKGWEKTMNPDTVRIEFDIEV